jgi:hypothetical protein
MNSAAADESGRFFFGGPAMTKMTQPVVDGESNFARGPGSALECTHSPPIPPPSEAAQPQARIARAIYLRELFSRVASILNGRDLDQLIGTPLPLSDPREVRRPQTQSR